MAKNRRKHIKQLKLTKQQTADMMANKLRAKTIPSKKKYNRKRKDKHDND